MTLHKIGCFLSFYHKNRKGEFSPNSLWGYCPKPSPSYYEGWTVKGVGDTGDDIGDDIQGDREEDIGSDTGEDIGDDREDDIPDDTGEVIPNLREMPSFI